jgi:alcohol dehydrogenase
MIDFSGSPQAMEQTLDALHIGGTAVWIGATYPQPAVPVNAEKMVRKIWTIKGLHNYNETDFIHAVEFMENNYLQFPFEKLIHDGFSLDDADEAFKYAIDKNPFRVGVHI